MTVTSGNEIAGHTITKYLGIVRGIVVRSPTIAQGLLGGLKQIVGGNIQQYANVCESARQDAFELMVQHAEEHGANAIIGMRYDATEFAVGVTEVLAYGHGCPDRTHELSRKSHVGQPPLSHGDLPGPIEEVFQVVLSTRAWVGAVAVVEHGESGILGDPVAAEPFDLSQATGKWHPGEDQLRQGDQVPGASPPAAES